MQLMRKEVDDYYRSFYLLDILTALIVLAVVLDLSSLFFSHYADVMEIRGAVNGIVGASSYLLVGAVCFFGFWDVNWQFAVWEEFASYDSCFRSSQVDALLRASAAKEMDGARYMRVVRFVAAGLFFALSVFNGLRWCRRGRSAKQRRGEQYREDARRKSAIMGKSRLEHQADPDDSAVKPLDGSSCSRDAAAVDAKKSK